LGKNAFGLRAAYFGHLATNKIFGFFGVFSENSTNFAINWKKLSNSWNHMMEKKNTAHK
jgi:hypothetical protein